MRASMRRGLSRLAAGVLAAAVAVASPGQAAWAAMAKAAGGPAAGAGSAGLGPTAAGGAGSTLVPAAAPAASAPGLGSLLPSLAGPALQLGGRALQPGAPALQPGPPARFVLPGAPAGASLALPGLPLPAMGSAAVRGGSPGGDKALGRGKGAARRVVAAPDAGAPETRAPEFVGRKVGTMADVVVPALSAARDSGSSPERLHAAGTHLESVLVRGAVSDQPPGPAAAGRASGFKDLGRLGPPAADGFAGSKAGSAGAMASAAAGAAPVSAAVGAALSAQGREGPAGAGKDARRRFRAYSLGISAVKVGIETLNLVVPIILLTQLGTAVVVGALFVANDLASMAAAALGGAFVDRLGPTRVLVAGALAQAASVAAMAVIMAGGAAAALPAVYALFVLNGAVAGVFEVARRAALPEIVGKDEAVLRAHNSKAYIMREVAATAGVFGAGWLARAAGAIPAMWAHPAFSVLAMLFFARIAGRAGRAAAAAPGPVAPADPDEAGLPGLKGLLRGAREVFSDRRLLRGLVLNLPLFVVHKLFHALVAVVYATKVLGDPSLAAIILGVWNLGELAGAWRMKRAGSKEGTFGWLGFAAAASLGAWLLVAAPSLWTALPVTFALAVAMMRSEISLSSFFQAEVPEDRVGAVTGFVLAASTVASMLSLLGLGWLVDSAGPLAGLAAMAGGLTAAAALFVYTRLRRGAAGARQ